jgi:hypothetical protein
MTHCIPPSLLHRSGSVCIVVAKDSSHYSNENSVSYPQRVQGFHIGVVTLDLMGEFLVLGDLLCFLICISL